MRKIFICIILFVLVYFLTIFNLARGEEKRKAVTQGEVAENLAEKIVLGIPNTLPAGEYFNVLKERGVTLPKNPTDVATKASVEKILIEAGRLQAEVLSGSRPEAVLKERGIIVPDEINQETVKGIFKDQSVNRLLETPALSGPSVPFPEEGAEVIESRTEFVIPPLEEGMLSAPIIEDPPPEPEKPEPPPTPPEPPQPPRPSGGGAQ